MPRTKGSRNIFKNAVCSICGKQLSIIDKEDYVYKLRKQGKLLWYCSYTCWRKDGGDGRWSS